MKDVNRVKLMKISEIDLVSKKLLSIPNVQKFETIIMKDNKFTAKIEMEDGYTFKVMGIHLERVYPGTVIDIIKRNENISIIVAPYISDRTAEICISKGIGYFDYSGNCYYVGHSLYLFEKGNKNIVPQKSKPQTIFEKSSVVSSKILRTLFTDVHGYWRIKYISESLSCSIGQVSKVINYLQENAWIEKTKSGYRLIDSKALVDEWSRVYGNKETRTISAYSLDNPTVFEKKLMELKKEKGIHSYLTAFSGGARYAPVVRYNKIHLYMRPEYIAEAMEFLGLKEVDSGSNVTIFCLDNDAYIMDAKVIDGLDVVSPVQIYLDAMQLRGRGEEMAEAVYNKEIDN